MHCPNCLELAELVDVAKGLYECTNKEAACCGLRFVDVGNDCVHIEPATLHVFYKASQAS